MLIRAMVVSLAVCCLGGSADAASSSFPSAPFGPIASPALVPVQYRDFHGDGDDDRQGWDRREDRARERAERRRERHMRREEQRRNERLDRQNRRLDQRNRELDQLNRELDERNRQAARWQRERSRAAGDW